MITSTTFITQSVCRFLLSLSEICESRVYRLELKFRRIELEGFAIQVVLSITTLVKLQLIEDWMNGLSLNSLTLIQ
jgi:hypothetical protein